MLFLSTPTFCHLSYFTGEISFRYRVFKPQNVRSLQNIVQQFRLYVCTWDVLDIAFSQNGGKYISLGPNISDGRCKWLTPWLAWRGRGGGGGSAKHDGGAQRDGGSAVAAAWRLRWWRQRDKATSAAAWRRRGGGGSAKHGSVGQRDGGSAVAAARRLRRWRQRDSAASVAAWRRRGGSGSVSGGGGKATAQRWRWRDVGGSLAAAPRQRQWQRQRQRRWWRRKALQRCTARWRQRKCSSADAAAVAAAQQREVCVCDSAIFYNVASTHSNK
jgi:hypothetical protein